MKIEMNIVLKNCICRLWHEAWENAAELLLTEVEGGLPCAHLPKDACGRPSS